MTNTANTEQAKTKKEIEAISERMKKTKLKFSDVLIPVLVVAVLLLLSVFVFIPMIKTAISYQSEYSSILAKEKQLKNLQQSLSGIDEGNMQIDLINAKKVIPNTLKVSSFVYYIDNLASQKSLKASELSAGDVKINLEGETSEGKYILGVSGPLGYSGSYTNIVSFLDSLYSASPYIIGIENITLEGNSDAEWKVTLNVTGYYVPESTTTVNLYNAFTPYTAYSEIVKIFETKASQLD